MTPRSRGWGQPSGLKFFCLDNALGNQSEALPSTSSSRDAGGIKNNKEISGVVTVGKAFAEQATPRPRCRLTTPGATPSQATVPSAMLWLDQAVDNQSGALRQFVALLTFSQEGDEKPNKGDADEWHWFNNFRVWRTKSREVLQQTNPGNALLSEMGKAKTLEGATGDLKLWT